MAITKLHPIKYSALSAVEYITNPDKTEGQLLVTSFRCDPSTVELDFARVANAGSKCGTIKAQHLIQSFAPGEVDEMTAHDIGIKLAERFTEGKHQYVIATHIDREHVHNHIIFNQVDFMQHKKFRGNKVSVRIMQQISDDLCKSYGLSVIEEKKDKGQTYYEWQKVRSSKTGKEVLKRNIDLCISISADFDDFLKNMQKLGYTIKNTGTYYSFKLPDQQRFRRLKTLGDDYSEEEIKRRLQIRSLGAAAAHSSKRADRSNLLSGLRQDLSSPNAAYRNKVAASDAKKVAQTYNFLSSRGMLSFDALEKYVSSLSENRKVIRSSLREIEEKLADLSQAKEYLDQIDRYQKIYDRYVDLKKDPDFFLKHRSSILLYEGAQNCLKKIALASGMTKDQVAGEIEQLRLKQTTLKSELALTNASINEISDHYQNAGFLLDRHTENLRAVNHDVKKTRSL